MLPTARRQARLAICLTTLLSMLAGCRSRAPKPDRIWLDFTDQVWHQSGKVSTDLISASRKVGLESLAYGFRQVHADDPDRAAFELHLSTARLFVFSADGDTTAFEIEVSVVGKGRLRQTPLTLTLNDRHLTNLRLTREWQLHRVEIPSEVVRKGRNRLEFRFPLPKHAPKWRHRLRPEVRNLRFFAATGRKVWPQRPASISLEAAAPGSASDASVVMAVCSKPCSRRSSNSPKIPPRLNPRSGVRSESTAPMALRPPSDNREPISPDRQAGRRRSSRG